MASKYVISAVDLKAVLDKIEAEGIITIDPYPINQYLPETINLSEVAALSVETTFSDSTAIQESIAILLEGGHITEVVSVSEAAVIEFGPGVTDTITVTEEQLFTVGKALSDTLGVTESLELLVFVERFPTDTITVSDTPAILFSLPAAESISVSESPSLGIGKALSDAFTVDDTTAVHAFDRDFEKNKTNVFSMLESHAIDFNNALSDAPVLSESAALAFSTVESDSISMADDSVELRLNGFLVGAESSVLNAQSLNEFTLNS